MLTRKACPNHMIISIRKSRLTNIKKNLNFVLLQMIRSRIINYGGLKGFRFASHDVDHIKRFIQTISINKEKPEFYSGLNFDNIKRSNPIDTTNFLQASRWSEHKQNTGDNVEFQPTRRSRTSRFKPQEISAPKPDALAGELPVTNEVPIKKKRVLKPRKAIITLSSSAVDHLKELLEKPEGKYIRIGVQNRGCSGLTYQLEYVNEGGKFDELVVQDGVQVFVDSKALFSIVGSEMDWLDDKLSSRFIFKNPNSKGTCGCGESFMV